MVQRVHLAPHAVRCIDQPQEHIQRVQHQALGVHLLALARDGSEQPFQGEITAQNGVGAEASFQEKELAVLLQGGKIPAQCGSVLPQLSRGLL